MWVVYILNTPLHSVLFLCVLVEYRSCAFHALWGLATPQSCQSVLATRVLPSSPEQQAPEETYVYTSIHGVTRVGSKGSLQAGLSAQVRSRNSRVLWSANINLQVQSLPRTLAQRTNNGDILVPLHQLTPSTSIHEPRRSSKWGFFCVF